MKKFLVAVLCVLSSSAFSFELENPTSMKWGAKFSHFSCERFSPSASSVPLAFQRHQISLNEFGINREMKYVVFNAYYGPSARCEYRAEMLRRKETQTAEFVRSEATEREECVEGRQYLDELFSEGMHYAETGRGHRYLSFKFFRELENGCQDVNEFFAEFVRIR